MKYTIENEPKNIISVRKRHMSSGWMPFSVRAIFSVAVKAKLATAKILMKMTAFVRFVFNTVSSLVSA